jgi:hypothetical protein
MALSASCFELKVPIRFVLSPGLWLNIFIACRRSRVKLLGESRGGERRNQDSRNQILLIVYPRLELASNEAGKGAKLGGGFAAEEWPSGS